MNDARTTTLAGAYVASQYAALLLLRLRFAGRGPFVAVVTYLDESERLRTSEQHFGTVVAAAAFSEHLLAHHPEVVQVDLEFRYLG